MSAQPGDPPEVTPPDVAAWLRARTQDSAGREVGLWTEDTRPTVGQVEQAIEQAKAMVGLRTGQAPILDACAVGWQTSVALMAATIIEQSYFPEQIAAHRSSYEQLEARLEAALEGLTNCIVTKGGVDAGEPGAAYGVFEIRTPLPEDEGSWMVPANWNAPYADDIDAPVQREAATDWLAARQPDWSGEIDQHGNPIPKAP